MSAAAELFPEIAPTHIMADAGDRRSLCGLKDPYPHVLARFVQAHVNGWGMPVCPDCSSRTEP